MSRYTVRSGLRSRTPCNYRFYVLSFLCHAFIIAVDLTACCFSSFLVDRLYFVWYSWWILFKCFAFCRIGPWRKPAIYYASLLSWLVVIFRAIPGDSEGEWVLCAVLCAVLCLQRPSSIAWVVCRWKPVLVVTLGCVSFYGLSLVCWSHLVRVCHFCRFSSRVLVWRNLCQVGAFDGI